MKASTSVCMLEVSRELNEFGVCGLPVAFVASYPDAPSAKRYVCNVCASGLVLARQLVGTRVDLTAKRGPKGPQMSFRFK